MTNTVVVRLADEQIAYLKERAREEKSNKSVALRNLIDEKMLLEWWRAGVKNENRKI